MFNFKNVLIKDSILTELGDPKELWSKFKGPSVFPRFLVVVHGKESSVVAV